MNGIYIGSSRASDNVNADASANVQFTYDSALNYIGVRKDDATAGLYYEFWKGSSGWQDIRCGNIVLLSGRISHPDDIDIYVGNANNAGWVKTQDICSQNGLAYWNIKLDGTAIFSKVSAANGFFKESDIRLKSNIIPLNHTLDDICSIPTVSFDMYDKHQIGTIAQQVEPTFPELVTENAQGYKTVEYSMFGVLAIEAVKLLRLEVEDLKLQISELKNGSNK